MKNLRSLLVCGVVASLLGLGCRAKSDGTLFVALIEKKLGYIDSSGRVVLPPRYENALPFSEGRAAVMINGHWGYIDRAGTVVIPAVHHWAREFHGGVAIVDSGLPDRPYGLMDSSGAWIVKPSFRSLQPGDETGQFFIGQNLSAGMGFYDRSGKLAFGPFDLVFPFSEGYARIDYGDVGGAVLDTSGNVTLKGTSFDGIRFSEGVIAVRQDKKLGYMTPAG